MNISSALSASSIEPRLNADKIGVIASVLCAIHCGIAPFLLIIAPAFGQIWAHPASHWIVALFVVPLAGVMVASGFRKHRKTWVVAVGIAGMLLVLVGAAIPYWNQETQNTNGFLASSSIETSANETLPSSTAAACTVDTCCPSLTTDATGNTQFHIPLASIVTTLGGILLICTHIGNICCCISCRKCKAT